MGKIKRDKADELFSYWIRLRDKKCKRCGSKVGFNAKGLPNTHDCSHFKGRGKEGTRFEPLNCDTLCMGCHMYFTSQPDEHYAWQVQTKGQDTVDKIILAANTYKKKDRVAEKLYWRQKILEDHGLKV